MKPSFLFIICSFLLLSSFDTATGSIREDVLTYTNSFRKSNGLPALIMRDDLNALAQRHSEDMARGRTRFGHGGFEEREAQARKKIPDATMFGENVAYGVSSGSEAVAGWKKSPEHRRNLLADFKYIGIGVATDRRGVIYYTQLFVN